MAKKFVTASSNGKILTLQEEALGSLRVKDQVYDGTTAVDLTDTIDSMIEEKQGTNLATYPTELQSGSGVNIWDIASNSAIAVNVADAPVESKKTILMTDESGNVQVNKLIANLIGTSGSGDIATDAAYDVIYEPEVIAVESSAGKGTLSKSDIAELELLPLKYITYKGKRYICQTDTGSETVWQFVNVGMVGDIAGTWVFDTERLKQYQSDGYFTAAFVSNGSDYSQLDFFTSSVALYYSTGGPGQPAFYGDTGWTDTAYQTIVVSSGSAEALAFLQATATKQGGSKTTSVSVLTLDSTTGAWTVERMQSGDSGGDTPSAGGGAQLYRHLVKFTGDGTQYSFLVISAYALQYNNVYSLREDVSVLKAILIASNRPVIFLDGTTGMIGWMQISTDFDNPGWEFRFTDSVDSFEDAVSPI